MRRMVGSAVALVLLAGSPIGVAAGSRTAAPAGGPIQLWVVPNNGSVYKIVITGAIGDYGTATSMTKSGKVEPNGNYVRIKLRHGTFDVNSVALNKKTANAPPTMLNKATCSFVFDGTGPVTLYGGTGDYAGISGTIEITETFAGIGPLYKTGARKGRCNMSNNANPVSFWSSLTGKGTVKFG